MSDILSSHGLRDRIKIVASGKLTNPGQVAGPMCGADIAVSARGFMLAWVHSGLTVQSKYRPTGITTHDPKLQRGLVVKDKAERVARYAQTLMEEVETIAHSAALRNQGPCREHCRQVMDDGSQSRSVSSIPQVSSQR